METPTGLNQDLLQHRLSQLKSELSSIGSKIKAVDERIDFFRDWHHFLAANNADMGREAEWLKRLRRKEGD